MTTYASPVIWLTAAKSAYSSEAVFSVDPHRIRRHVGADILRERSGVKQQAGSRTEEFHWLKYEGEQRREESGSNPEGWPRQVAAVPDARLCGCMKRNYAPCLGQPARCTSYPKDCLVNLPTQTLLLTCSNTDNTSNINNIDNTKKIYTILCLLSSCFSIGKIITG